MGSAEWRCGQQLQLQLQQVQQLSAGSDEELELFEQVPDESRKGKVFNIIMVIYKNIYLHEKQIKCMQIFINFNSSLVFISKLAL